MQIVRQYNVLLLGLMLLASFAKAADPVVSNVRALQRNGTKLVDIWYDLRDAVTGVWSAKAGVTYHIEITEILILVISGRPANIIFRKEYRGTNHEYIY